MARGILFKPEMARLIRAGRKTRTVRLSDRSLPQPGEACYVKTSYREPARNAELWVIVDEVGRQTLGSVNAAQARAEGFDSVDAFLEYFRAVNGAARKSQAVHYIAFHRARSREVVRRLEATQKDRQLARELANKWRLSGRR